MNKTFKRLLCAAVAAAMSTAAAVPVFAGTGASAAGADGGVIGRIYRDFESFDAGTVFSGDPERGVISIEGASDLTYEIADDNGNKVMKITRAADGSHNAGIKLLPVEGTLDDADYWVVKYDLKNGDTYPFYTYENGAGTFGNEYPYINQQQQFRNDGESIEFPKGSKITFTPREWHEFMFIGNKATGNVRLVLDGKDCGETACERISSAGNFFGVQIYDNNSGRPYAHVMYVDDMEIYGIKSESHKATATLTADNENSKVYVEFDYPVTGFDASKVQTSGGTVTGVSALADGRYEIALEGLAMGRTYTVSVAGVTDVFGATVDSASTEIAGTESTLADGIFGKVSADFEKFTVGQVFAGDPERGVISIETAADLKYEIAADNGGKVMKITRTAGGSSRAGIKLLRGSESLDDADYWVVKYDFKNGDSAGNEFGYLQHQLQFRNNGESVSWPDDSNKKPYTAYQWHEYMFIGNKATGKIRLVLDGKDYGEQNCERISSASDFFGVQIYDMYSSNANACTMYVDNMEIYGVKSADRQAAVVLSADENEGKIYAEFSALAADFDASKVTIDGGAKITGVAYDETSGKWVISYDEYKAGAEYNVAVASVTDIFGAKTEASAIKFKAPKVKMPKTYLTTQTFLGYDDFEGYNGTGAFETKAQTPVSITRKSDNTSIKDIWSNSTGSADTVECSLADDGTGNHAYKISATAGAVKDQMSGIFQPVYFGEPYYADWTEQCKGKYFVYELKFRGGSATEDAIGAQIFETLDGALTLDYGNGTADVNINGKTTSYENAFKVKEWNTLQYVVDCSRETAKTYLLINGKLLAASVITDSAKVSLRSNNPRMGSCYLSGKAGASVYFDDVAIYAIDPLTISQVTAAEDSVTVTVKNSYENGVDDAIAADVYVAVYAADGSLAGAAKATDSVAYGINDYTANISAVSGGSVKAFIWNSQLEPLCAAK